VATGCSRPGADTLAGDYRRQHRVFVFHGNEPVETEVEDRLSLDATGTGGLRFAFRLIDNNGESCEMEGVAVARSGRFEYRSPEQCTLQIRKLGNEVLVEDVGDNCRERYCGDRASIGRVAFGIAS
jgi:hypothetical protein